MGECAGAGVILFDYDGAAGSGRENVQKEIADEGVNNQGEEGGKIKDEAAL